MGPPEPAPKMGIINIFKYVTPLWKDNFKQIEKTPETGSANVQIYIYIYIYIYIDR